MNITINGIYKPIILNQTIMKHPLQLHRNTLVLALCAVAIYTLWGCREASRAANVPATTFTEQDKSEIEALAREIPLILANDGWEAYQEYFADGYQNWAMAGDKIRSREEYLGMVRAWYDQGNRATGSDIESIGFIPVSPDLVLYLNAQREVFNNPQDSTGQSIRDIRFISVYKREDGQWKNYFTAFMDAP